MTVRRIVQYPDPILKQKANPVIKFDKRLHKLLDDLNETMIAAHGVGLAAPQIAILKRVFVVNIGTTLHEVVNPTITAQSGWQTDPPEGCLSIPHLSGVVRRANIIKVAYQDRHGQPVQIEAEGYLARAFQHEIDHLDGILFIDRTERVITRIKEEENE